jgi:uncharacterized SAM-binding protein YcdF (DUF218 family)
MGVIRRLARVGLRAGLVVFLATLGAVTVSATVLQGTSRGPDAPVDAVIVLGGGVAPDGYLEYDSRRRTRAGVALLRRGLAGALILSGGLSPGRSLSDAALMREHALALGAPAGRLIVEDRAVSTFENLRFSFAIAEARGFDRLAILSDPHHLARARLLARFWGRPEVALVATQAQAVPLGPSDLLVFGREALAWWYNLAKVAGWEALGLAGLPPEARGRWVR